MPLDNKSTIYNPYKIDQPTLEIKTYPPPIKSGWGVNDSSWVKETAPSNPNPLPTSNPSPFPNPYQKFIKQPEIAQPTFE